MTSTMPRTRTDRYGASAKRPHTAIVFGHVATRLGPKCTGKAVEHKLARATLLLELLIEEAHRTGETEQCDKLFAELNARRHAAIANRQHALRHYVVANSTEMVERSAWQETPDSIERRREIDALAEEIVAAEVLMVQLETVT